MNNKVVVLNKDEIVHLYVNEKLSLKKILTKFKTSHKVIKRILIENNIEIRSLSESCSLSAPRKKGSEAPRWGKKHTELTKAFMSASQKRKCEDPDYQAKMKLVAEHRKDYFNSIRKIFTQSELHDLYFSQKLSMTKIAQKYKTPVWNVSEHFKKFNFVERSRIETAFNKVPVCQYDMNWNFIQEHESVNEAARSVGCFVSNISMCCRNVKTSAYGFRWKYKE